MNRINLIRNMRMALTVLFLVGLVITISGLMLSSYAETKIFTVSEYTVDGLDRYFTLDFNEGVEVEKVTSSNEKIVGVDDLYSDFVYFYSRGVGKATITATDSAGNTDTCVVTVKPEKLVLDTTELSFTTYYDGSCDYCYVYTESNDFKSVVSSDRNVAETKLDEKNCIYVRAVGAGMATITVTDIYNQTATITVEVSQKFVDDVKYLEDLKNAYSNTYYGDTEIVFYPGLAGVETEAVIDGESYIGTYDGNYDGTYIYSIKNIPVLPVGTVIKYTLRKGESVYESTARIQKGEVNNFAIVDLSKLEYVYNGTPCKPAVKVEFYYNSWDRSKILKEGTDYKVSYSNNKNVGKATVKVTGLNQYSGSTTENFTILPKGTTVSRVKAAKKGFIVKWKKQSVQTTGYQIQYSLKSNFSGAKTVTVKKISTTSKKITKLKAKKKYYIRIRTYKTVGGKKYCSAWSETKTVKAK